MFDVHRCSLADVDDFRGAIPQMLGEGLDGLVVEGAFPVANVRQAVSRLWESSADLVRCDVPNHSLVPYEDADPQHVRNKPYLLGRDLIYSPPDLVDYLDSAARFRRGCARLFEGGPDFEAHIARILSILAGTLPVKVPRSPAGESYAHATVRVWPEGHEMGLHNGFEILNSCGFAPMRERIDVRGQLSYFVLLQKPASGGVLYLHDVRANELDPEGRERGAPVGLIAALRPSEAVTLEPGDLIVFDAGRVYHRVSKVGAGPRRVTIGGFLAMSQDHEQILYWS